MGASGLDKDLDELLASSQPGSRYLDLCLVLRRPLMRVRGRAGLQLQQSDSFRAPKVTLRPVSPMRIPSSGEVLIPVTSAPDAVGASAQLEPGINLTSEIDEVTCKFEPVEVLRAGGCWDRLSRAWSERKPERPHIIDLQESQVEFAAWFATWLRAFRTGAPRDDSAVLNFGGRRAGKTVVCLLCVAAALIDVEDCLGWAVSVSHVERDVDIDRNLKRMLPAEWYQYREWPAHKYTFINRSTLTNVSADDPEGAKRGQVDVVLINEAAKQQQLVFENSLGGTADRGGIVIAATNPPTRTRGEWVEKLVTEAEEAKAKGEEPLVRIFRTDHRQNLAIDQKARGRIGRILHALNPALAAADDDGLMRPVGDRALYAFQKTLHAMRRLPDLGDITEDFTRRKRGRPYQFVIGVDFQKRPYIAGTVWKIFGTFDQPELWCVAGFGVEGNEDDFLDELAIDGRYHPLNAMVIADATGVHQNFAHENGKTSWGPFFARAWDVVGPQEKKQTKSAGPTNPRAEVSLGQYNRLLGEGRVHIIPDLVLALRLRGGERMHVAEGVAQAFRECRAEVKRYGMHPVGDHAHTIDTARYVGWWVDPPKESKVPTVRLNRASGRR